MNSKGKKELNGEQKMENGTKNGSYGTENEELGTESGTESAAKAYPKTARQIQPQNSQVTCPFFPRMLAYD